MAAPEIGRLKNEDAGHLATQAAVSTSLLNLKDALWRVRDGRNLVAAHVGEDNRAAHDSVENAFTDVDVASAASVEAYTRAYGQRSPSLPGWQPSSR